MNPSAEEFVPKKKRMGPQPPVQPSAAPPQQPPQAPQQQQQTKLRASAPAFVPKAAFASAAPRPFHPQAHQHHNPPHHSHQQQQHPPLPPQPSQPPTVHADPLVMASGEQPSSPGSKSLSLSATPYTPTNPKVAAKFPSTPQPQQKASDVGSQQQQPRQSPSREQEQKQSPQQQQPQQSTRASGGLANRTESVPPEESVGSTSATDDNNSTGAVQPCVAPAEVVENDFSGSMLPTLFDAPVVNKPAPADPVRFNTVWALYADDHPTPFGVPLAYDPVLVHLIGDVECFWRLWRYLPPPSALSPAFTYHWFRRDIKPNWEHARNKNGGTVTIVIFDRDKPGQNSKQTMDDAFMTMLMACCGETLAESTATLNGIMLKVRQNKPTTVQLWTANSDQRKLKALAGSLRTLLEKVIGPKPLQKLEYFSHQQTQVGGPGSLAGRMKGKPTRITPDFTL